MFVFEPLIKVLEKCNISVEIASPKSMEFYFKHLGYSMTDGEKLDEYELIISRTEVFSELREYKNILLFEYITNFLEKPICEEVIEKVLDFICIEDEAGNSNPPSKIDINSNFKLDENCSYILFSNYLDSSKIFTRRSYYKKLNEFCREKSIERNLKVIHIGSLKDKKNDSNAYDFVNMDLRGKTEIKDLFYLVSHPNVLIYIGFDTFPMHLSMIYNKICHVKLRNFLTKKRFETVRRSFIPPFSNKKKIIVEEIL